MNFNHWYRSLKPSFDATPLIEKFCSSIAALFGVLLLGEALHFLPDGGHSLMLFASMAAVAVLLYAVPHSPMAQPWPLLVGNLLSGAVGFLCSVLISDQIIAAACAVGLSIFVMHLTHSLHPPGAATAMTMVLNATQIQHFGWQWTAIAVMANAGFSLLFAVIINNLVHAGRYPVLHRHLPSPLVSSSSLAVKDIEWALGEIEGVVDVDEEELLEIYRLAVEHSKKK